MKTCSARSKGRDQYPSANRETNDKRNIQYNPRLSISFMTRTIKFVMNHYEKNSEMLVFNYENVKILEEFLFQFFSSFSFLLIVVAVA